MALLGSRRIAAAFVVAGAVCAGHAAVASSYKIVTLIPPGESGQAGQAVAINDAGQVVVVVAQARIYLWTRGTFRRLPFPAGFAFVQPSAISPWGLVIGVDTNQNDELDGFAYSTLQNRHYVVDTGSGLTLPSDINSRGQITGTTYVDDPAAGTGHLQAVIYDYGRFTLLRPPGSTNSSAVSINDAGAVVGTADNGSSNGNGNGTRCFAYSGDRYTFLAGAGWLTCLPSAINNSGDIAGTYLRLGSNLRTYGTGFVFSKGRYTDVRYPGAGSTSISALNAQGEIVGHYFCASGSAQCSDRGKKRHLYRLFGGRYANADIPGAVEQHISGLNEAGSYIGFYGLADGGRSQAFVAVCDPPGTLCWE